MKIDPRLLVFVLLLLTGGALMGALSGSYANGEQLYLQGPVVPSPSTPLIVLNEYCCSGAPVGVFVTNGNPNSVISANVGSIALDIAGGGIWVKTSGANPSNTGWTAH
jgi:hypothetical protein